LKKLLFIILAIILVSGLLFASCSTKSTPTTSVPASSSPTTTSAPKPTTTVAATTSAPKPTTTAAPTATTVTPQFGGVLKVITDPGLTNIGYPGAINAGNDGSYRQPALEELVRYSPDGKGTVVPCLATEWKFNADYTTLTFTLRKGVKFHDGTDFNAAAAKFSLDMVINSVMTDLKTVSSTEVVDDYTLRLNLKNYDSALLINLANYICPMVSPTAINKMTKEEALLHPVGTGPFKFVSYSRDSSLKFERFADYWQKPKPYLDGIEFSFISDPVVRLVSLKAGDGHIVRQIPTADAADLKATGKFAVNPQEMAVISIIGDSAHSTSPFSNLKVRQALSYAIDSATIAKTVGKNYFLPCNQIITPLDFGYNPKIVGYPYNADKAKQLLSEAGFSKGFDTKVSYTSGVYQTDFFTMIQSYFKVVGINLTLDVADAARYNDLRLNGFTNQLLIHQNPAGADKDMSGIFRDRLSSTGKYYNGKTVYYPDEYTTKLALINQERDDAKRLALLQEVNKIAVDDYCLMNPILVEMGLSACSIQVKDSELYRVYAMSYRSEDIWLSK
jgi:peptide/nickel transport system substrate-binding protein